MTIADPDRLRSIKTFPQLVKYLRDDLEWPIESDNFDDLTFDYEPEELGLDAKTAVKIKEIKQLRPLHTKQPWGVFFINFEPKRLPVVVLRRILSALVVKKRQSAARAQQATWKLHDLMFISSYGESDERTITFAHFCEGTEIGDLPTLHVLTWDDQDTVLHLADAHRTLRDKLRFPDNPDDVGAWRQGWASAFTLRHREVITTSKALAEHLAELATRIRRRANAVLVVESEKGPLRSLHTAFQQALIHDLTFDDFADMYAQTIAYGLLTARVSRPAGLNADSVADMVPVTNPFLKELLETFLTVGGRRGKLDFDELGISDVVGLLREANMEAVLRDFGDRNPQEDPVVHFYELFLKEYDPKKRIQRGVFYTPRPVVSYIVRSVHELLQTEFGLEDGLASTATWEEVKRRFDNQNRDRPPFTSRSDVKGEGAAPLPDGRGSEFKIPDGMKPSDPFVCILDPAVGTATFLVEVIDVIYKHLSAKWDDGGAAAMPPIVNGKSSIDNWQSFAAYWNQYVPLALLPRLHGYELLMAPYAIAHMKIGLKLHETGYRFGSDERARVYLTNSLEPPSDDKTQREFEEWAPALAHEARAVNAVKRNQRFTVVIGNPPYAAIPSNVSDACQSLFRAKLADDTSSYFEVDGKSLGERNPKWLNDDYVKFVRYAQAAISNTKRGLVGMITNHGYLLNPTFRGMRRSLMQTFDARYVLDLHGNSKRREQTPAGEADANVFDIQQGVAISLLVSSRAKRSETRHADLWAAARETKYTALARSSVAAERWMPLSPTPPLYLFVPQNEPMALEYAAAVALPELFGVYGVGLTTAHDEFVIDWTAKPLIERAEAFRSETGSPEKICKAIGLACKKGWDVHRAQRSLRAETSLRQFVEPLQYRPFDQRLIFYHDAVVWRTVHRVMDHMRRGPNLGLISARSNKSPHPDHFFCTRSIMETKCGEASTQSCLFPLHLYEDGASMRLSKTGRPASNLQRKAIPPSSPCATAKEEEIFNWIYALVHSPSYRSRFAEFFTREFPRVFFPANREFFQAMITLGSELVSLHLLESRPLDRLTAIYTGPAEPVVEKVSYSNETVWIDKAQRVGFAGVPEDVWNFHIGGYQVCQKWLKDRKGRVLSADDITHYHRIVVALHETIRLMAEIDKTIDAHGGWPGAFTARPNER